jgi:L-alanine-DL-glutamate epimerase-like enolase superfamily enzyme
MKGYVAGEFSAAKMKIGAAMEMDLKRIEKAREGPGKERKLFFWGWAWFGTKI